MTKAPNDRPVAGDAPANRVSNREAPLVSWTRQVKRFFRKGWSTADVFTRIYAGNRWSGQESVSGRGSDSSQTQALSRKLPPLLREIKVRSILDAPCGDLFWMRDLDLDGIKYTGIDIVSDLIEENQERFAASDYRFLCSNLICDPLPRVDLILCRDCLVHLSYEDALAALRNMQASQSTWLLTTTFTGQDMNWDIVTGEWRTINLERQPFDFPSPITLLDEECPHENDAYRDKMLGLWRLSDLQIQSKYDLGELT